MKEATLEIYGGYDMGKTIGVILDSRYLQLKL